MSPEPLQVVQTRPLIIGMIGATGSGKSTFLVAAHATSLKDARIPCLRAVVPTQKTELAVGWEQLKRGTFPSPNRGPSDFLLRLDVPHTTQTQVQIQDHRGGVLDDNTTPSQTEQLVARLAEAEAVFLMLDGEVLSRWCAGMEKDGRARASSRVRAGMLTSLLLDAVAARTRADLPPPAVALVVTKDDFLVRGNVRGPLPPPVAQLRKLLPVTFSPAITTLVCTVGVGRVNEGGLAPHGFLAPFIYAALCRVTVERAALRSKLVAALRNRRATAYTDRVRCDRHGNVGALTDLDTQIVSMQRRLTNLRMRGDQFMAELRHFPIVRGARSLKRAEIKGMSWP